MRDDVNSRLSSDPARISFLNDIVASPSPFASSRSHPRQRGARDERESNEGKGSALNEGVC